MWEQKKVSNPETYQCPPSSAQAAAQALYAQQSQQFSGTTQQQYNNYLQQQQMMAAMSAASPLGPPPPYTPYAAELSQQQAKYVTQMGYYQNPYAPPITTSSSPYAMSNAASYSYPNTSQPNYQYNPYGTLLPNTTVVMPQGYDAGARFDGISRPHIPPPPPGVVPNAAQLAAMQGQNAAVGQKKSSWLEGGSSGGYTFW